MSWSALLRAGAAGVDPGASIAQRVDDHAVAFSRAALGVSGSLPVLDQALYGWLDLVKGTCLRWLEDGRPEPERLHALLAGCFVGAVRLPPCGPGLRAGGGGAQPLGPQPGGRESAVEFGQNASRGEPVWTSSGRSSSRVSSNIPAVLVRTATSETYEPGPRGERLAAGHVQRQRELPVSPAAMVPSVIAT